MIKHIKCDIFESGADVICHQVNCQGVMGSGIAKQVREKYPDVYESYKLLCENNNPEDLLGESQFVSIIDDKPRGIINIFGQLNYGYDGKCYTNYDVLKQAFDDVHWFVNNYFVDHNPVIAFPYKFGCARGGGDWNVVYKMIEDIFGDSDCEVLICEYNGG